MMHKDKIIKVDEDTRKKIGKLIAKEIEQSLVDNKKVYSLIERCKEQYEQVTIWEKKGKEPTVPFKGAADYFVPVTEWIIDAVFSRLMNQLFYKEPLMEAKGTNGDSTHNEQNVTDFVNMVLIEIIKVQEKVGNFFKKMIQLPISVMKYDWVRDSEQFFVDGMADVFVNENGEEEHLLPEDPGYDDDYKEKALQLISNGYSAVTDKKPVNVLKAVDIYNDMRIDDLNPMDYVWASNTKKGQKPFWEGNREWYRWDDIKNKGKEGIFYSEAVVSLKKELESMLSKKDASEQEFMLRNVQFEGFDWYGKLPFNSNKEIDFTDNVDTVDIEVHAKIVYNIEEKKDGDKATKKNESQSNTKTSELLYLATWEYERLPIDGRVYIIGGYEDTEEFYFRSLSEKLYKTQKLTNTIYNTIINNAYLSMMKIFKRKRTFYGEELEDDIEIYPGAIIDVNEMDDLQPLEIGDLKNIGLEIEKDVMGMAERISNISDWSVGTRKDIGKATATEFAGIMQESNIGTNKVIQRAVKIMQKVCEWTVAAYQQFMPEGLERRLTGKDGETIFPTEQSQSYYDEKGVQPFWTKEQITGKYDFRWNNNALNSNQQYNIVVANDLMDKYSQHPMIASNLLAVWQILKDGLVARGKKNINDYLPPREAVVAEVERKKAEDELRQNQERMQKQFPTIVAQKLVERGVDPAQAQVMAQQIIARQQAAQQTQPEQQGATQ